MSLPAFTISEDARCAVPHDAPSVARIRAMVLNSSPHTTAAIASILERDVRVDVVATAKDGIVGLRTAIAHAPDLVVTELDAAMPGSFEVVASLKEVLPDVKIMVVCEDDDRYLAAVAEDFGADAFLPADTLSAECESQLVRLFPALHIQVSTEGKWGPQS